ncbi:hypothetical protein EJ05DRAFT_497819 [Pseudovirgaria hyperparasitica]|uniref:DUF7820 domain-containing protein n=1 Tax=Pseudovirgaria hyperparasitica TaxID=470096 RepID=A0A6A6WGD1_9PEZI|nr:uncharacterized protein EJ05DRAFT_497819 [Pseudovirgaria hyperparasitica]KAF2761269.1 hypothetical protein EJ05DRAFT_497819 [Pseudovirgaria hyperparasitica]
MDRPTSRDDQPHSPASTHTNVFDDEFEAGTPADDTRSIVADGFRPQVTSEESTTSTANDDVPAEHDQVFAKHTSTQDTPQLPPIRNSIAKGAISMDGPLHRSNDSDGQSAYASQALMHRASVASTNSFVTNGRSSTPMAGPSHPYAMYPQGTGPVRSPSNATSTVTRQPQRSYSGQRPTHPYTMYPQNLFEGEEPTSHTYNQQQIPVGFPGHGNGYTRQIGPDGEEQDIIGPDGHTEQLPPYSKYPEDSPKGFASPTPAVTTTPVSPPAQPHRTPSPVDPPLPLDILAAAATDNVSMVDRSPAAQNARASVQSATHSAMSSSPSSEQSGHKKWTHKTWTERRKTRVCGRIPLWLLILMAGLIIIFAIILGAAIGSIFTKAKKAEEEADHALQVTVTEVATLYDASIIPTPSDMLPLPTGSFSVQMGQPQDRNPGCLPQVDQQYAWSCDFRGPQDLQLGVRSNPSVASGLSMGELIPPNVSTATTPAYQYGMQPPNVDWRTMDLVIDHDQPSWGPAFHFQAQYNKLVILEAHSFPAGIHARKRDDHTGRLQDGQGLPRHQMEVVQGDRPWFCWWNSTFLEVYLYANQYSFAGNKSMNGASQTITLPLSTPTPTLPTPVTSRQQAKREPYSAAPTSPSPTYRRDDYRDSSSQPAFPRIVKVEERRIPGSPPPVCTQMVKLEDGTIVPANQDYEPIIVNLNEDDPSMADFAASHTGDISRRSILGSRGDPADGCHCQWVVT